MEIYKNNTEYNTVELYAKISRVEILQILCVLPIENGAKILESIPRGTTITIPINEISFSQVGRLESQIILKQ